LCCRCGGGADGADDADGGDYVSAADAVYRDRGSVDIGLQTLAFSGLLCGLYLTGAFVPESVGQLL
jgi:hypothetical protein